MSVTAMPVLREEQIVQKVRRIAFEIFENNFDETELLLVGVAGQGWALANMLQQVLQEICAIKIILVQLELDKQAPFQSEVKLHGTSETLDHKCVILVDDVLNTGRTLAYSFKPFLQQSIRKLEVAVLVNRRHTTFPVQANYTGYELATTLSEHIEVKLTEGTMAVYLR